MNKYIWKKINPADYFSHVQIPDDWSSLEEFADWYLNSKMPMMIPFNAEVIRSDDACAICLFRKGNYQVELYLEYPEMWIRKHSHPRMDVIVMQLGGGNVAPKDTYGVSKAWGEIATTHSSSLEHGGNTATVINDGFVTLAFERWDNPDEMTSAAVQWKGELQGPIQEALIKRRKKNAIVSSNYADVTNDTTVSKD